MRAVPLGLGLMFAFSLALLLQACVVHEAREAPQESEGIRSAQPRVFGEAVFKTPPQSSSSAYEPAYATPVLPKWQTPWERSAARKSAGIGGSPLFDSYDDYRSNSYESFFITKAPGSVFRFPAEYEPSQAYMLSWDANGGTSINTMYKEMITSAWGMLPVIMITEHASHQSFMEGQLLGAGIPAAELNDPAKIIWWEHTSDSMWVRDYGPLSLVTTPTVGDGTLSMVDFRYYHMRIHDDEIPTDLAQEWGVNVYRPDLTFEGGNLMNTADGLCAASKGVIWHNPQLTQSAIEELLRQYVGCQETIFPTPLSGESTTHIDMFAKFGPDARVLVGEYLSGQDAVNKGVLDDNAQLFATTTTPGGDPLEVTRIPMPNNSGGFQGKIWRTYTNSLALAATAAKAILIPTYADETTHEAAALAAYSVVFPGWTQHKIDSQTVIRWGGATHCLAIQIPLGESQKMEADPEDLCGPQSLQCAAVGCGSVLQEGCCADQVLKYCQGGVLMYKTCATDPSCGWNSVEQWYSCSTAGAADPGGTNPHDCDQLPDAGVPDATVRDAAPAPCGAVTIFGCCDGQTVWYCDGNRLQWTSCAERPSCGWNVDRRYYGCQTSGQPDPEGVHPMPCSTLFGDGGPPRTDGPILDSSEGPRDAAAEQRVDAARDLGVSDLRSAADDLGGEPFGGDPVFPKGQGCYCEVPAGHLGLSWSYLFYGWVSFLVFRRRYNWRPRRIWAIEQSQSQEER